MTTDNITQYDADEDIVGRLWPLARPHVANPDDLDDAPVPDRLRAIEAVVGRTREQAAKYGDLPQALDELMTAYRQAKTRARPQLTLTVPTGPTPFERARFELADQLTPDGIRKLDRATCGALDRVLGGSACADLHRADDQAAQAFAAAMAKQQERLPVDIAHELAAQADRRNLDATMQNAPVVGRVPDGPSVIRGPRVHQAAGIVEPPTGPGTMRRVG